MGELEKRTFECADCGDEFERSSETEALEELRTTFGDVDPAECGVLCDDCYAAIMRKIQQADTAYKF